MPRHALLGPFAAAPSEKDRSTGLRPRLTVGADIAATRIARARCPYGCPPQTHGGRTPCSQAQRRRITMITLTNERNLDDRVLSHEIDRLVRLAADLRAIRDGHGPTAADL